MSSCKIHHIKWAYDIQLNGTITIDELIYKMASRFIPYDILQEFRDIFDKLQPYNIFLLGYNIIFIGPNKELICKIDNYNIPAIISFSISMDPFIYYRDFINKYSSQLELYDVLFDANYKLIEPVYNKHYIHSKVYNLCNRTDEYRVDKWLDVCIFNNDIDMLKGIYNNFNFNILRYGDILYLDDQFIYFYVGSRFLLRCEVEKKIYIPKKVLNIVGLKTYISIIKDNGGASIELPYGKGRANIIFDNLEKTNLLLQLVIK